MICCVKLRTDLARRVLTPCSIAIRTVDAAKLRTSGFFFFNRRYTALSLATIVKIISNCDNGVIHLTIIWPRSKEVREGWVL